MLLHQRAKFRVDCVNRYGDMVVFRFLKMRPSAILGLFYVYLDHPRTRAFVGLCNYAKFGWNRCSSFDNMPALMFCEFGLKISIHAPFWCFGGFDPLYGAQYQPISHRLNLRFITVRALYYYAGVCSSSRETA